MSNDAAGLLMQRVSKTKRAELKWGFDELDIALDVDERIPETQSRHTALVARVSNLQRYELTKSP